MKRSAKLIALGTFGAAVVGSGIAVASTSAAAMTAPPATHHRTTTATVNVARASVNGRSEQILVDSRGLPLYTYAGDSKAKSAVTGGLAAIWPPLVSNAPTEHGTSGTLKVVHDSNGAQVEYNGHFLYTFVSDAPGKVTGQGDQNFFVATARQVASPVTVPTPTHRASPYAY